jgi:hypothetical protein
MTITAEEELPQEVTGTGRYRAQCLQHDPPWYGVWQDTYGAADREVRQHNNLTKHHGIVVGSYDRARVLASRNVVQMSQIYAASRSSLQQASISELRRSKAARKGEAMGGASGMI